MTTTFTMRIEKKKKAEAEKLFNELGLGMSTAINLFLSEALAFQGIPFEIRKRDATEREMLAAMDEARRLVADPNAKRYDNVDELLADALQ
jgi:DNA-damage-inducible protein J